MPLLADETTRVVVYGIGDPGARLMASRMLAYGTHVVAGVQSGLDDGARSGPADLPVYAELADAVAARQPNAALIATRPGAVLHAALKVLEQGVRLLVISADGVARHDTDVILDRAHQAAARVIGPDSAGLITPAARLRIGSIGDADPASAFPAGRIGVIAPSAIMAAAAGRMIARVGLGVSTAIDIGAGPSIGTTPAQLLPLFQRDAETVGVVLCGEPDGRFIEDVAQVIGSRRYLKPLLALIPGRTVTHLPEGDAVQQAIAILERRAARLEERHELLREVGAVVTGDPRELPLYLRLVFKNQAAPSEEPFPAP